MPKKRRPRSRWGRVYLRGHRWYVSFRWTKGARSITRSAAETEEEAWETLWAIKRAKDVGLPLREVLAEFFNEGVPATITLKDAIPRYLADQEHSLDKSPKTMAGEKPHLLRVAKLPWANQPLLDIETMDIKNWLLDLRAREGSEGSTLNRWASAVSVVFRWAAERGIIPAGHNPVRGMKRFKESSGREVFLTAAELESWVESAPESFRVMARLYARTGFRRDEARLLQWRSVDLGRKIVRVEAELSKNSKYREVPLTPDLLEALSALRSRRALESGSTLSGNEYVFALNGKPWNPHRVQKAFKQTVEKAGDAIEPSKREALRLHDIRHTFGAILASKGISERIIAQLLGHKSLVTTRRYAHLFPEALDSAIAALSDAISNPQPDRLAENAS